MDIQYKEKKPKDTTIAEKFNTYRFADYKEQVVDLLQRVCRVSVETMGVVGDGGREVTPFEKVLPLGKVSPLGKKPQRGSSPQERAINELYNLLNQILIKNYE